MSCDQWVNDALDVMENHGGDAGRGIVELFDLLDGPQDIGINIVFADLEDLPLVGSLFRGVDGVAPPVPGISMFLDPALLASDPKLISNWEYVVTLAHETVHLSQTGSERLSIQGEAKTYQVEYELRDALRLGQTDYTRAVRGLDLSDPAQIAQAHANFDALTYNIYTWQPTFPIERELWSRGAGAIRRFREGIVDIGKAAWQWAFGE